MLGSLQDALGALLPVVRDERAACAATIARELRRWHAGAPARRLRRMLA